MSTFKQDDFRSDDSKGADDEAEAEYECFLNCIWSHKQANFIALFNFKCFADLSLLPVKHLLHLMLSLLLLVKVIIWITRIRNKFCLIFASLFYPYESTNT